MALTLNALTISDGMGVARSDDGIMFFGIINFDSSYPTGGYVLQAGLFSMNLGQMIVVSPFVSGGVLILSEIIFVGGLKANLKLRNASTGAELANTTNLSGATTTVFKMGY